MFIIPIYFRLNTFTKTLPQTMSFHLYFLLFLFRSGAPPLTLLTAGALTDPQLPATASNVCMTNAMHGWVGRPYTGACKEANNTEWEAFVVTGVSTSPNTTVFCMSYKAM